MDCFYPDAEKWEIVRAHMEKRTAERRKYPRVKSSFNIRVDPERDGRTIGTYSFKIGKSINISASGVLFGYDQVVGLGTIMKVIFLKPNSFEFFQGKAQVVRTEIHPENEAYHIGIVFLGLDRSDAEDLNYYVIKKEWY